MFIELVLELYNLNQCKTSISTYNLWNSLIQNVQTRCMACCRTHRFVLCLMHKELADGLLVTRSYNKMNYFTRCTTYTKFDTYKKNCNGNYQKVYRIKYSEYRQVSKKSLLACYKTKGRLFSHAESGLVCTIHTVFIYPNIVIMFYLFVRCGTS